MLSKPPGRAERALQVSLRTQHAERAEHAERGAERAAKVSPGALSVSVGRRAVSGRTGRSRKAPG